MGFQAISQHDRKLRWQCFIRYPAGKVDPKPSGAMPKFEEDFEDEYEESTKPIHRRIVSKIVNGPAAQTASEYGQALMGHFYKLKDSTGRAAWVVCTSLLVLGLPLMLAVEEEVALSMQSSPAT
eukprot:tig00000480_g1303.t1